MKRTNHDTRENAAALILAVVVFALVALVAGCAGPLYTIHKGDHSSGIHFSPGELQDKGHAYDVQFTPSCYYRIDTREQSDWNKLCGQSAALLHQEKSIRWGWRCNNQNVLEINPYLHIDGQIVVPELNWVATASDTSYTVNGPIPVDDGAVYRLYFQVQYKAIRFLCWDTNAGILYFSTYHNDKVQGWNGAFGYALYPWFGGTVTAPHNIEMFMVELDWINATEDIPVTVFE